MERREIEIADLGPPVSETTVMHVLTRHSLYSTQRKYCIKSSYGTKPTTVVVSGYRLTLCSPGCQFESRLSDLLVLGPNLINDKWDPRVLFRYFSVGWFFEQTLCAVRQVTARVTRILQVYEQK